MLVSDPTPAIIERLARRHALCFERPWTVAEMTDLVRLPTTRYWDRDGGFLLCTHVADEMEILTIGVVPDHRRHGIAWALLQDMISYARTQRVGRIFLEVSEANVPARTLYERAGFVQTGRRKAYYQTGAGMTDALCLTLGFGEPTLR